MHLSVLQEEIRACRKCVEAGYLPEARPLTRGEAGAPYLIVGQAPSRTDHESGGFYVGPAGRKLRSWLTEAGYPEEEFGRRVYFAAITKCFPGRLPGSSKDRVPSRTEQALCRPWLDAEMAALRPRVLILFGGLAISTFLSRRPLTELIGRTFETEGRLVVPLPHSSGASTWLNQPENRALLAAAIERLREARLVVESGVENGTGEELNFSERHPSSLPGCTTGWKSTGDELRAEPDLDA